MKGRALVLAEPLSFWGGIDSATGAIIDAGHPDRGKVITGCVLVMESGRGSSSSSSVFAETIRLGTGPIAIILERADPILTTGAVVARTLYGIDCPVIVRPGHGIRDGDMIDPRSATRPI